ncbi:hypothetical protein [Rubripirellula reticaptiva]|uniref:Uncharacterized protein n=1 Tax=Rubripirellula reticaptiva TaxID=2528013 RepID=A0A5C6EMR6_9BACT|nr:hypothetical protein [Rubripirellula reticaptiva]TWU49437.1 hypothetical protein Poly59_40520 [Rubripirellula reticaptiva]
METKKKESKKTQKPVHTVRRGAIAASIWKRQSMNGYCYFEYSLSRSYKSQSSGKEGYSSNFFDRNAAQVIEVIKEASAWIEEQSSPADETEKEAA